MKPALLIIMLVCTTTAASTARAVDTGMGDTASPAMTMPLDQGPSSQAISDSDAAPSNNNASISNTEQHAASEQIRLPASPNTKTVISPRSTVIPANVSTPAAAGDDASRSHAASWQSLLPGSIQ